MTRVRVFSGKQEIDVEISTLSTLTRTVRKKFEIPSGKALSFRDVNRGAVLDETGLSQLKDGDIVVVVLDNETDATINVDIVPSATLMFNAGQLDYTLETAIAELVDNSIQATLGVPRRGISVVFKYDTVRKCFTLEVADTGKGMTQDELTRWARLGATGRTADDVPRVSDEPRRNATSLLSRYGVGAKQACLKLGNRTEVTSRSAKSSLVHQLTLDRERFRDADAEWTIDMRVRTATKSETLPHFTNVLVLDVMPHYLKQHGIVDPQPVVEAMSARLRRWLCHVYHFYIFGVGGNFPAEVPSSPLLVGGPDAAAAAAAAAAATAPPSTQAPVEGAIVTIKLNRDRVERSKDKYPDFLSECFARCRRESVLEMRVPVYGGDGAEVDSVNVRCMLLYFPMEGGQETMPVDRDGSATGAADTPQRFTTQWFWQGRLITGADSLLVEGRKDPYFLERPKAAEGVREAWHRRAMALLFFDDHFSVTQNKARACP
jgi:hypothetical protein